MGFRGEVTDKRLSPTYSVVKEFLKNDLSVYVHDPYIILDDELPPNVMLSNDLSKVTKNADLIFISTDHKKYSKLSESSFKNSKQRVIIFDGRNILDKTKFKHAKIKTIGI